MTGSIAERSGTYTTQGAGVPPLQLQLLASGLSSCGGSTPTGELLLDDAAL
jgi:hypothetical protein